MRDDIERKVIDFLGDVGKRIVYEAKERAKVEKREFKDVLEDLIAYYFGRNVAKLILG